jgi:hypothetical protein
MESRSKTRKPAPATVARAEPWGQVLGSRSGRAVRPHVERGVRSSANSRCERFSYDRFSYVHAREGRPDERRRGWASYDL